MNKVRTYTKATELINEFIVINQISAGIYRYEKAECCSNEISVLTFTNLDIKISVGICGVCGNDFSKNVICTHYKN